MLAVFNASLYGISILALYAAQKYSSLLNTATVLTLEIASFVTFICKKNIIYVF
jgi:hypothetical protein